jgi:hypothetical protein
VKTRGPFTGSSIWSKCAERPDLSRLNKNGIRAFVPLSCVSITNAGPRLRWRLKSHCEQMSQSPTTCTRGSCSNRSGHATPKKVSQSSASCARSQSHAFPLRLDASEMRTGEAALRRASRYAFWRHKKKRNVALALNVSCPGIRTKCSNPAELGLCATELSQAIEREVEKCPAAQQLMTHPGVNLLSTLKAASISDDQHEGQCPESDSNRSCRRRLAQEASYLGLVHWKTPVGIGDGWDTSPNRGVRCCVFCWWKQPR